MTARADPRLLRAAVFTAVCVLLAATGHTVASGTPLPPWALGAGCALVLAVAAPLAGRARSLPCVATLLAVGQAALHLLFAAAHQPPHTTGAAAHGDPHSTSIRALARTLLCNEAAAGPLSDAEARRIVTEAGLGGHPGAGLPGPGPGAGTGHGVTQHAATTAPTDGLRTTVDTALAQLSLPMLLAHLLAAAAVGWLLHRGDAALRRLVRLSAVAARAAEKLPAVRALRTAVRLLLALRQGPADGDGPAPRAPRPADGDTLPPRTEPLTGAATRRGPPAAAPRDHLGLAA